MPVVIRGFKRSFFSCIVNSLRGACLSINLLTSSRNRSNERSTSSLFMHSTFGQFKLFNSDLNFSSFTDLKLCWSFSVAGPFFGSQCFQKEETEHNGQILLTLDFLNLHLLQYCQRKYCHQSAFEIEQLVVRKVRK